MNFVKMGLFINLARNSIYQITRQNIHQSAGLRQPGAYSGEGKTSIHILNQDKDLGILIDGYSQVGFRLNNQVTILGSMVIFPRSVLSWKVDDVSEITEEALSLFSVLEPKIDILVLGVGDKIDNFNFYQKLLPFSRKHRIPFEILPTEQACATFNFLNVEGRNVVAALIPPKHIVTTAEDELQSKLRYQNLYEDK
ncbi:NADH dehydrogenase [ubiquinone] 1 alpha subcomplex assembly factor 3 [Leptinotarsa decemlineata]|uniref:NADH dehydrogenase [ubiquinone] 1 alpha subcomplex assembly factor 3 n=1 Tax=Leptinotarsa decemlineata TaxID=7539 RepID=UPI000C253F44|nr:NADH dehydrogenase [ubiquinone] 1 alpha subcomplex assembly factor 3 [Leptinotarsa decemlineata]